MQTAKQLHKNIVSKIIPIYGEQESSSIAFIVMEYFTISKQKYVLNERVDVNLQDLELIIDKLKKSEPIQYVLGEAWFYDRKFYVDDNVLIPRPETEELCQLIINRHKYETQHIKLLDIGTGSGCIPITLDLELENVSVTGLDVSKDALSIAQKNAKNLNSTANFIQKDILNNEIDLSNFDIIVSNPPYVLNSEKELMCNNVLENEPHLALFVDNENPLLFYNRIVELSVKGRVKELYFEINEKYGTQTMELMKSKGFTSVTITKDLQGKERFVFGKYSI